MSKAPQLGNSGFNLMHTLQTGHTYSASGWIQTADGPNMSDEDRQRANDGRDLLLKY